MLRTRNQCGLCGQELIKILVGNFTLNKLHHKSQITWRPWAAKPIIRRISQRSVRLLVGVVAPVALGVGLLLGLRAGVDHLSVLVDDHVGILDGLAFADVHLAHGLNHPSLGLRLDALLD